MALKKGSEADDLGLFPGQLLKKISGALTEEYDEARARTCLAAPPRVSLYYFGEKRGANGSVVEYGTHPACACAILREKHAAQTAESPVQVAFDTPTDRPYNR